MDDLTATLSGILNDPESMEKVRKMAEGLFSGSDASVSQANASSNPLGALSNLSNGQDSSGMPDVASLMKIMNMLKTKGDDSRSGLLLALKPHLSYERQERVDKAVKILKLVSLMPILKDSGLLNL